MTLAEWAALADAVITPHRSELYPDTKAVIVVYPRDENLAWELCHLSDYVITTRSGPVAWLFPRDLEGGAA